MLATLGWLSQLYRLPRDFVLLVAVANTAYGCYSLTLSRFRRRPMPCIVLLVVANLAWAALCFYWVGAYWGTAGPLGLGHLAAEGLFVGGLGALEWRWRRRLVDRPRGGATADGSHP